MKPQVLLPLIPLFPLMGFLLFALAGRRLERDAKFLSVLFSALPLAIALLEAAFLAAPRPDGGIRLEIGSWIAAGGLSIGLALSFTPLAAAGGVGAAGLATLFHALAPVPPLEPPARAARFAFSNLLLASVLFAFLAEGLVLRLAGLSVAGLSLWILAAFRPGEPAAGAPKFPWLGKAGSIAGAVFFRPVLYSGIALWIAVDVVLIDGLFVNGTGIAAKTLAGGLRRLTLSTRTMLAAAGLVALSALLGFLLLKVAA